MDLETVPALRTLAAANRVPAELKGHAATIPNQGILIDTLPLQEAKASSEIENIITTQDGRFQADLFPEGPQSGAAKDVALYRDTVKLGCEHRLTSQRLITNKTITDMFRLREVCTDRLTTIPGTALRNEATRDTVCVPPQDRQEVADHTPATERSINDDYARDLDLLIKMAIVRHQFERIHPLPVATSAWGGS